MFNSKQWKSEGVAMRSRICIRCGKNHLAFHRYAHSPFCPDCSTPALCKEANRVNAQNGRANRAGAPATLTLPEWLYILDHFHWKCAYCQREKHQLMEHIISISKGGGTIAANVVPACIGCNTHKDRDNSQNTMSQQKINRVREELAKALEVTPGELIASDEQSAETAA